MDKEKIIDGIVNEILELKMMGLLKKELLTKLLTILFNDGQMYQIEKQLKNIVPKK